MNKDQLLEIGIQKRDGQINLTWQQIADTYGEGKYKNGELLRSWVKNQVLRGDKKNLSSPSSASSNKVKKEDKKNTSEYKETFEIHKDGSHSSSKLIRLSLAQEKNERYLLEAHGFDPDEWELINAKASEWSGYSKQDGQFPMYASKITVRPLQNKFNFEKLLEVIKEVKPIHIEYKHTQLNSNKMLEIPLFDAHFGISDYEYYESTQAKINDKIIKNNWEEILFIIGQDMLHNNDHRGRTANGTPIQSVDMEKAWNDCRKFYEFLIESAIKNSKKVKIIYSKGNHDETISWAFVQFLKARFPQVEFYVMPY